MAVLTDEKPRKRKLVQICTWQPIEVKAKFKALHLSQNKTESALLGQIVLQVLKLNPDVPEQPPKEPLGDSLDFRFPKTAKAKLLARAAKRNLKLSEYCATVLLSHLSNEPFFTDTEFEQVREMNRQMAAIGRNLNQLTKAINAIAASGASPELKIELQEFKTLAAADLKSLIQDSRESILNFAQANVKSWKANNE